MDTKKRINVSGFAMDSATSKFRPYKFTRRALKPDDILIRIKFAGICHSDIHTARGEWGPCVYPIVTGHEIAGEVVAIGPKVKKFKIGDNVGVGCMVNSCGKCSKCKAGYEQNCSKCVFTYNSKDGFNKDEIQQGGYSNYFVVTEKFAIKAPKNAPLEYVAPLLCAGITTYAPIVFSKVKKGQNVGIAGFGGLGSMAVKYAKKIGANVYVFARNNKKEKEAKKLGVKKLYTSLDNVKEEFDFIMSTIPNNYDVIEYMNLLKFGGEMAVIGLPPLKDNWSLNPARLIMNVNDKKLYGSIIGGIKLTQEMLDFSLKNKIYPEIEIIKPNQISETWEKMTTGKGKFRYVIDMRNVK
ncbi:NAD(P)-dependent alcohol dehydrogenase [Mycoplasmoides alvi]|uniref:NAD(P)-dependent alcohol dehydrogenase n=1 Tax=Mycoplasmoides alvi TaxID=78580 RepID=UPI00051C4BF3|nr:NAD(P)-dependent alcohol dehydrogenase [Mycoplasmoides alvi]